MCIFTLVCTFLFSLYSHFCAHFPKHVPFFTFFLCTALPSSLLSYSSTPVFLQNILLKRFMVLFFPLFLLFLHHCVLWKLLSPDFVMVLFFSLYSCTAFCLVSSFTFMFLYSHTFPHLTLTPISVSTFFSELSLHEFSSFLVVCLLQCKYFKLSLCPIYSFFYQSQGGMDGWLTCNFTSFSTVLHSYQENVWAIMKSCVQWNPVYN